MYSDPAQVLASKSHLNKQLVAILSLPHISKHTSTVPHICKILALLVPQEGEFAVADPSTVNILLSLANQPEAKEDIDVFIALIEVAVAYLANEDFQLRVITEDKMGLFVDTFYYIHAGLDINGIDDEDAVAQLKELRVSLLSTLADISGNDQFATAYPLQHAVPQTFLAWIRGNNSSLQTAACLALGNTSRSDKASIALVDTYKAHEPLTSLLASPAVTDSQLLHAACSFLKNLAIPADNKTQLEALLRPQCVPRVFSLDTLPLIQFAAVSLTRLLLLNCPSNVRQICAEVNTDSVEDSASQQSSANGIISLFGRSDAEPTKVEAARCVAGICRVLYSSPVSEILQASGSNDHTEEARRAKFFEEHQIETPIRFLITQEKWPSLRSEVWFVLALMSRSKDGARVVASVLDDKAVEAVLVDTITGQKPTNDENPALESKPEESLLGPAFSSEAGELQLEPQQVDPKQQASMLKLDRENALILCTELKKNSESGLSPEKLAVLQNLVRTGTQLVVADRTKT